MIPSPPPARAARKTALAEADAAIAADASAAAPRFVRARLLTELGRTDEARQAYMDLLAIAPDHAGALNNLGSLLAETGYRTAARLVYEQAIARHPDQTMARINLGNLALEDGESEAAKEHYLAALALEPDNAEAHRGLAYALDEEGDAEAAARHRRQGFAGRAVTALPYRGEGPPVEVLLLISAAGGNVRTAPLLDDRTFAVTAVAAEFLAEDEPLPSHAVVFNAIGDADRCGPALDAAERILRRSGRPVVNRVAAVRDSGRREVAERLAALPGVVAPKTVALPREAIAAGRAPSLLAEGGLAFPLLLRSPGFHTGRHFVRVAAAEELDGALAALPGGELVAIAFLDGRGADGLYRKYRAMFVDGDIYPLHLAVSPNWKIHYFSAAMADRPDLRDEEAAYLNNMESVLGAAGTQALARVRDCLGLDYGGIDFGIGADGRLLLFEANATMAVVAPDADPRWDYRRPHIARVIEATRRMVLSRAGKADPAIGHEPHLI